MTANDYTACGCSTATPAWSSMLTGPAGPRSAATEVDLVPVNRLSDVQSVHAMSVHRSQGSQFDRVTLVLPPGTRRC